jgi:hypothetical protein
MRGGLLFAIGGVVIGFAQAPLTLAMPSLEPLLKIMSTFLTAK